MKRLIIFTGMFVLYLQAYGQDRKDFFLDEFYFSANRTAVQNEITENKFGFGLGTSHVFRSDKKINVLFGIEYNRTSQFKKYVYEGRFQDSNNITYQINCLSFYTGTRLNPGNSNIFYIDAGIFVDFVLSASREGEGTSCSVENDSLVCSNYHFDEDARLSGSLGFYCGVGFRVPISKFELIIKPEYKYGLNPMYSYGNDVFNRYFRINIGIKIN